MSTAGALQNRRKLVFRILIGKQSLFQFLIISFLLFYILRLCPGFSQKVEETMMYKNKKDEAPSVGAFSSGASQLSSEVSLGTRMTLKSCGGNEFLIE